MTDRIKALLSRLNPKSNFPDFMPRGGIPHITEHDIAAAMGMIKCHEGARVLARVKWAGHTELFQDLYIWLHQYTADHCDFISWTAMRSCRPGLIIDLCKMAVSEYCYINNCPTCGGRKEAKIENKVMKCITCDGFGMVPFNREKWLHEIGLPKGIFYRVWREPYKEMLGILDHWNDLFISAMANRLK